MKPYRGITDKEKALIGSLLSSNPDRLHFLRELDTLLVAEMEDGGMGSLRMIPAGMQNAVRKFGVQLVTGEFLDSDGVSVSVAINLDTEGNLYELDMWKVNFAPLLQWPDADSVRILN